MAIEAGKDDLQIKIILCTLYIVYIVPKIYCESQCLSTPSMTKYPKKLVVFLCYSGVNRQGCFLLKSLVQNSSCSQSEGWKDQFLVNGWANTM